MKLQDLSLNVRRWWVKMKLALHKSQELQKTQTHIYQKTKRLPRPANPMVRKTANWKYRHGL